MLYLMPRFWLHGRWLNVASRSITATTADLFRDGCVPAFCGLPCAAKQGLAVTVVLVVGRLEVLVSFGCRKSVDQAGFLPACA
jgi:hypothetical protein